MKDGVLDLSTPGHRLRYARKCLRWQQQHVAKIVGIPVGRLNSYECSQRSMPVELARLLAWAYDVPWAWVESGEGETPCRPATKVELFMLFTHGTREQTRSWDRVKAKFRHRPTPVELLRRP